MSAQIDALVAQCVASGQTSQAIAASRMRPVPGLKEKEIHELAMKRARSGWIDGVMRIAKLRMEKVDRHISALHARMREIGGFDSDYDKSDEWLKAKRSIAWEKLVKNAELRSVRDAYFKTKLYKKELERRKCVSMKEADQLVLTCANLNRLDDALKVCAGASPRVNGYFVLVLIAQENQRHNDALDVAKNGVTGMPLNMLVAVCIELGHLDIARQAANLRPVPGLTGCEIAQMSQACARLAKR